MPSMEIISEKKPYMDISAKMLPLPPDKNAFHGHFHQNTPDKVETSPHTRGPRCQACTGGGGCKTLRVPLPPSVRKDILGVQ